MLDKIWKSGRLPEEWRMGIISPIHKREEKEDVRNYRGTSLLCTTYKIYAIACLMKGLKKKWRAN